MTPWLRWSVLGVLWLVSATASAAPTIDVNPLPQIAPLGGEATFVVVASSADKLTYRWRKDGLDLADGTKVSGATADVLLLSDLSAADEADYTVVVTDGSGSATSIEVPLIVRQPVAGDLDFTVRRIVHPIDTLLLRTDGSILVGGDRFSTPNGTRSLALLNPDGSDTSFVQPFSPGNGAVRSLALQGDGKVVVAGDQLNRLKVDGTRESIASALDRPDRTIWSVALQADGKILVGGDFVTFSQASRGRLARVNADRTLDTSFFSGVPGADGPIRSVLVQPDGRILIGGQFTNVHDTSRNGIARLNPNGSLDDSFQDGMTGADGAVTTMARQPDGRILVGGEFSTINGVPRNRIARLHANGSLDTSFLDGLQGADGPVRSIVLQPNGQILLGGLFTHVHGVPRNRVARLNPDGSLDASFLTGTGPDDAVHAIAYDPSGEIWIAGRFLRVNGVIRPSLARLDAEGDLVDGVRSVWVSGEDLSGAPLALQPDGKIVIGGPSSPAGEPLFPTLSRWQPDGTGDPSFAGASYYAAGAIALQPDGKVLSVGRSLEAVNLSTKRALPDGTLDPSFQNLQVFRSNGLAAISALALQPDGHVLIGGRFNVVLTGFNTPPAPRGNVARLKPDGTVDESFLNGITGTNLGVYALALQPDGKVLIGGQFDHVGGVTRNRIARLHANGSLDTTFQNGMSGVVGDLVGVIAVQPDGKVLIGGPFTSVNGVARNRIARLNPDGSLDRAFQEGMTGVTWLSDLATLTAIALQPDGKVLIGGLFNEVNGVPRTSIARLNTDGSLDNDFQADATSLSLWPGIAAIVVAPDGRIWIGGDVTTINGVPYPYRARLYGEAPVAPAIASGPQSQVSYEGCCAGFHVGASGMPREYRWRKDGVDLVNGGNVVGADTDTLRLSGISAADQGVYSVVVSNLLGSDTSAGATLDVLEVPACQQATCDAVAGCGLIPSPGPGEVQGLQLAKSGSMTAISWTQATGSTSSAILRGDVSALPVGPGGGDEVCLASGLTETRWDDPTVPPSSSALWYLVRGESSCGVGSYGVLRTSATCP